MKVKFLEDFNNGLQKAGEIVDINPPLASILLKQGVVEVFQEKREYIQQQEIKTVIVEKQKQKKK